MLALALPAAFGPGEPKLPQACGLTGRAHAYCPKWLFCDCPGAEHLPRQAQPPAPSLDPSSSPAPATSSLSSPSPSLATSPSPSPSPAASAAEVFGPQEQTQTGVTALAGPQHSATSLQTGGVPSICCAAPQGLNLKKKKPCLSEPPHPLQQWGSSVGRPKGLQVGCSSGLFWSPPQELTVGTAKSLQGDNCGKAKGFRCPCLDGSKRYSAKAGGAAGPPQIICP